MDCIHRLAAGLTGLCPPCQADADYDPQAWAEYGRHPHGEANARELLEEIARDAVQPNVVIPGDDLPF